MEPPFHPGGFQRPRACHERQKKKTRRLNPGGQTTTTKEWKKTNGGKTLVCACVASGCCVQRNSLLGKQEVKDLKKAQRFLKIANTEECWDLHQLWKLLVP
mmetsp:Transcript_14764/g.24045  ORF Transcript_14764/g.24045 Transcript_14764/m.24045 type:complete len:101 (-) Transcript_14764:223-525(-)